MYITSTTQTQYANTTNKTNSDKEAINPFKGQDYILNTLDEEGNELLNDALVGKTDEEKWLIKLGLDMELSTQVKDGTLSNRTTIDNSKENAIDLLDAFIQRRKELATPDMIGVGATAEKLLEAYKNSGTTFDITNQEDSVVDDFLEDLYTNESRGFKSSIIKDEIKDKVNEYAQILMQENGDTPESELETSKLLNQYKTQLLQEYKASIENSTDNEMSAEQEAIIKVLMEENTQESSSLEKLLSSDTPIHNSSKSLYERNKDAIKDDSNSFGMFLKENDKAMELVDEFTKNMSEGEKGRFMFVFGHAGQEHLFKATSKYGLSSPSEAIPYVQNEKELFKDNAVFADSLQKMFNDKTASSVVKEQLREFYELYIS